MNLKPNAGAKTGEKAQKYLALVARLRTITSAPSRMVLVLNPLPSENKHITFHSKIRKKYKDLEVEWK